MLVRNLQEYPAGSDGSVMIARIIIIIHCHLIGDRKWGQERGHSVVAEPGPESRPPLTSRPGLCPTLQAACQGRGLQAWQAESSAHTGWGVPLFSKSQSFFTIQPVSRHSHSGALSARAFLSPPIPHPLCPAFVSCFRPAIVSPPSSS